MIAWCVRRPAVVWATCACILAAGGVAFSRLALATKTTVELPRLSVGVSWAGASPELMEMYVTSPVEAAIQGVRGVRRISSNSRDGGASMTVELDPDANVQLTRLGILERMEALRSDSAFPPGASRPYVSNYVPDNLQEAPLISVLMTGPYTSGAQSVTANTQLLYAVIHRSWCGQPNLTNRILTPDCFDVANNPASMFAFIRG